MTHEEAMEFLEETAKRFRDVEIFGVRYTPRARNCYACKHLRLEGIWECEIIHGMPKSTGQALKCAAFEWSTEVDKIGENGVTLTLEALARRNNWQCYQSGTFTWLREDCPHAGTPTCPIKNHEDRPCDMDEEGEREVSRGLEMWAKERWGEEK